MKKICFVQIGIGSGGVTKVSSKLCNELSERYEIHFVSVRRAKNSIDPMFSDAVKAINLLEVNNYKRKRLFSGSLRLRNYIKKNNIDLIVCQSTIVAPYVYLATLGLPVKVIVADHQSIAVEKNNLSLYVWCRRLGFSFSDKVVVLTEKTRKHFMEKYKIQEDKVKVIANWIDFSGDTPQVSIPLQNHKTIMTSGRYSVQKGYDLLLPVAKEILTMFPDWSWKIYGDGDSEIRSMLQNYIKDNNLEGRLCLEGYSNSMDENYKLSDLYVMTSRWEGLPLVLLEAKQAGLPIVSFDINAGPSDIVRDGVNGYLIKPFDQDVMIEKISELISDEEKRQSFSKQAHLDVEKFSKKNILKQWIDLIEEM